MTLRTPLCDMLGIKYPIMLAGMGGGSYGERAAAVSEAGGFGTLGMAGRSPDEIKREMQIVRDKTDKPFGVDLLAAVPESLERTADIIIEGGAKAFISGLGVPPPHLTKKFHDAGLKVMNVNGAVKHAVSAELLHSVDCSCRSEASEDEGQPVEGVLLFSTDVFDPEQR